MLCIMCYMLRATRYMLPVDLLNRTRLLYHKTPRDKGFYGLSINL